MNIEKEAEEFTRRRKESTRLGIMSATKVLREMMVHSLHASNERTEALNRLQEAELWALRCLDEHGRK